MIDFPQLTTERLLLRNFAETDAQSVYEIFSDDRVTEFHDLETFSNLEQAKRIVASRMARNEDSDRRALRWAICLSSTPSIVIGSCGFHSTNKAFRSIEIGYELRPIHWGKSYAFEAIIAMLGFCFTNDVPFSINRVSATTNLDSQRSITLLRRLGFTEEGVLRQYGYWKNKFHDLRMFSLLREEWKNQANKK